MGDDLDEMSSGLADGRADVTEALRCERWGDAITDVGGEWVSAGGSHGGSDIDRSSGGMLWWSAAVGDIDDGDVGEPGTGADSINGLGMVTVVIPSIATAFVVVAYPSIFGDGESLEPGTE